MDKLKITRADIERKTKSNLHPNVGCKSKSVSRLTRNNHFPYYHDPLKIKKQKLEELNLMG